MRKLATIQTIKLTEDIIGKDMIKLASFESVGWKVIVSINQKIGDKVVYFEPDSVLPVLPEFEFLRKRCFKQSWNGFVVRRIKMGNVLSEGLAIPTKEIFILKNKNYKDDDTDITTLIGVKKYDPELLEEQTSMKSKKYNWFQKLLFRIPFMRRLIMGVKTSKVWPSFISKTDETRVQNLNYLFNPESGFVGMTLNCSEKIDGQNANFAVHKNEFYVCSRNLCAYREKVGKLLKLKNIDSKYIKTALNLNIEDKLVKYIKDTGNEIVLQGEQFGLGIQKNKYNLKDIQFVVFNIRNISDGKYWSNRQIEEFCLQYGFNSVPYLDDIILPNTIEELLELSKGKSKLYDIPREGIVLRAFAKDPQKEMANMFSFKVINPDFSVKYDLE